MYRVLTKSLALMLSALFFFNDTATTKIYTLSLHDALPISLQHRHALRRVLGIVRGKSLVEVLPHRDHERPRSEEHTSELQSRRDLVCRLLLEKKKTAGQTIRSSI